MTPVDWGVLAVIAVGGLLGVARGAVRGTLDLVSLAAGVAVALSAAPWVARHLGDLGIESRIVLLICVLVITAAAATVGGVILRVVALPVGIIRAIPPVGWIDRLLGVLPGMAKGAILTSLVILAILVELPTTGLGRQVRSSSLTKGLATAGSVGFAQVVQRTGPEVHALSAKDVEPGQLWVGLETLPSRSLEVDLRAEQDAIDAINESRAAAGLPGVRTDPGLITVARQHARDAGGAENRHLAPATLDVAARLAAEGRGTLAVGAVMAGGSSVDAMVEAVLASEPHRDVVLSTTYLTAGFGVISAENGDSILVGIFVL